MGGGGGGGEREISCIFCTLMLYHTAKALAASTYDLGSFRICIMIR